MINQNEKSSSARLIINNIGNLKYADITIADNCVIAGHNNIGKSTITKVLYSIIKTATICEKLEKELKTNIEGLSEKEIELEVKKFQYKYSIDTRDNAEKFIKQIREHLYLTYIFRYLNSTLGKNIVRFLQEIGGFIFTNRSYKLEYSYKQNNSADIDIIGEYDWFKDATLISSTEVLSYSNLIITADTMITGEYNKARLVSAQDKDLIDKLNTESIDMLDEKLNIKEGLGFDKSGYAFYKENGNEIRMQMLGTGKKLFIILDKLLRNKSIDNNTLVMFDEPEEGMHPEWQLDFIEKLLDMKVPFALTTHSPYILQSLIHYTKKSDVDVKYYTVEHNSEAGYAESKEEVKPLKIVKDLTNPILKVRGF